MADSTLWWLLAGALVALELLCWHMPRAPAATPRRSVKRISYVRRWGCMICVSMPCSELRALTWVLTSALCLLLAMPALAHKGSDAYLQLKLDGATSTLRVDLALRDLDAVIDIDADANGQLTWGEVRSSFPAVERYLAARVRVDGCQWESLATALERRADGVYAALTWSGRCEVEAALPTIRYSALREVDPTHRSIAKIERSGSQALVQVLDPTQVLPPVATSVAAASLAGVDAVGSAAASGAASSQAAEATTASQPEPHATAGFLTEGMRHILGGYDHVLFLLALLLPSVMRRTKTGWQPVERLGQAIVPVAVIVTAFTIAHSVTLTLAGLKLVSLSSSFIEPAIALTIVLAAVDNLVPIFGGRRVIVTFLFGLIHGFGFAGVLGELNLPTVQFVWALFQFNLGIELGQLFVVAIAVSALFAFRRQSWYSAVVIGGGSAVAIVIGALWFIDRTANLAILPF